MKIQEYAQMMGWLTRPPRQEPRFMAQGGRLGYRGGQLVQPGPGRQGYAGKGTEQRVALSQWLKTQDKTISREALTKQVAKIWNTDHPQKTTSYLLRENPDLFKNTKILSLSDVKGTTAFRNYLKTTKKRSTTVSQLVKDFKKATGKTVDANVGNIGTEFSDKFNLATSKNIPPNKMEQKAINAYKKLSQEQKFAFQIGGPSQKGVYAKWLTEQGLDSGNTAQSRFRKLLEREGLYKKAPIKTSAEIAKKVAERTSGIGTSGATTYEQDLVKFKKETLKNLGITADRVPFDQAHRLSFKHMARLGEQYAASNIGTDFYRTNTSAARKLEIALEPLYDKQYNIWKKAKNNPSKELSKSLDKVNNQIADLVNKTSDGRIQGIQIDPYNLKVGSTPINYKYAADLGTTKKPLSEITKGSPEDIAIRLNYPEQIKKEALESGLIKKAPKNIVNILSNSGIKCALANGINCNDPRAYIKSINELKSKAALGDKAALGKFRKVANAMRKFKGPLAVTGWGILGEIGFALPFAAMDYADGKSTAQIMNNASFGLFGMNEEEEAISLLPKDSLGGAILSLLRAGERIEKLEDPSRVFPKGRMGMDENRFQKAQAKVIPDAELDFKDKLEPFLEGPRNEYYNPEKATKAFGDFEIAKAKQIAMEEQKAKERAATSAQFPEFKKGGRVSFKGGGMGRRKFLKLLAALGIGGATAGTGLLKLSGKAAGKKAAVTAGADIATSTPGMPSWFPALVNKIIKEGDDVTTKLATQERQVVHTKKIDTGSASPDEVTIYRDLDTGDIRVEVDSVSNMGEAPIQLDYKASSVIDEGKMAGQKTKPEFSAVETEPRVVNWDGDIEFDGENIVGSVDDLFSDTTRVKNYAKGEKPTMQDIVTRKKKTDIVEEIHERPGEHINNKYGDGPDYDDYASGGRVSYFDGGIVSLKKKW